MKRGPLRAAIVLILTFTAMAVWGEGVEKHSTMRNERLSVLTSGVVEFTADDGTKLTVTVSKNGDLRIGNSFELSVRRTAGDERGDRYLVRVRNGGVWKTGHIDIDRETKRAEERGLSGLRSILGEFNASTDGQKLQQLRRFIVSDVYQTNEEALFTEALDALSHGDVTTHFDTTDCIGAILNAIAAGAAMIAGCATPACGPYWGYCCVSGVAWYLSALLEISASCVWT
jgi:hypothetical protein